MTLLQELSLENAARVNRRQFFGSTASGIGVAALVSLLGQQSSASPVGNGPTELDRGLADLPHHPAKAKRVVVLWQGGGPSHVDLFDDKPDMQEFAGKDIPDSVRGTTRLSTMSSG